MDSAASGMGWKLTKPLDVGRALVQNSGGAEAGV